LSILKTILLFRGVDRDIRFALVRGLVKAKRIIEMDLRKNHHRIYGSAGRMPTKAPVGAGSEASSPSVHHS
jgi:hypothetical protein